METRTLLCQGPVCNPEIRLIEKGESICNEVVHSCTAYREDDGAKWTIPEGWEVYNGKLYCPRCVAEGDYGND